MAAARARHADNLIPHLAPHPLPSAFHTRLHALLTNAAAGARGEEVFRLLLVADAAREDFPLGHIMAHIQLTQSREEDVHHPAAGCFPIYENHS